MYEDAIELASLSGLGYSDLDFEELWPDMEMEDALEKEDVQETNELEFQEIHVPEVAEVLHE